MYLKRHSFEPFLFINKNKPLESNFLICDLSSGQDKLSISAAFSGIYVRLLKVNWGIYRYKQTTNQADNHMNTPNEPLEKRL